MVFLRRRIIFALILGLISVGIAPTFPMTAYPIADAQPAVRDCPGENYTTIYTNFDQMRS